MSYVNTKIKLSPSALSLFRDCPRCFWLDKNRKIKRPRGIFPSLPGGMDREIKKHFDKYRAQGKLPPEMSGPEFEGVQLYADADRLEKWRNWKTGPEYVDREIESILSGALDDLLVKGGRYIPFDYKTKGSPSTIEDAVKYYQTQLECYALLMEANGLKSAGFGYLLYYSPFEVTENGMVEFKVQPIKIETDIERARNLFRQAVELLRGPLPVSSPECEYCAWLRRFKTPFK